MDLGDKCTGDKELNWNNGNRDGVKGLIDIVDFKILKVRTAKAYPHAFCNMSHIVIKSLYALKINSSS